VTPFTVAVPEAELADLRDRLRRTRWPAPAPGPAWSLGADVDYLRGLTAYWADGFDWAAQQRRLNGYRHVTVPIDDVTVHAVRVGPAGGVPLLLAHGWPSTFAELLPLADLLADPAGHGIAGPAFELVIPSLPGCCWSTRPDRPHTMADTARLWHRLMTALGHDRYGVHGGDLGSGVGTFLALQQPAAVLGLHLNDLELAPYLGPGSAPLTAAERAYAEHEETWAETEAGYAAIQSTKPQSLAVGLTDSPAGLAAWVAEKWRSWSDSDGDLDARIPRDVLLTALTLLWTTGSVGPGLRDFADNRTAYDLTGAERVTVPTALTLFDREFVDAGTPPREWAERLYDVVRWEVLLRGGHFPALEEPRALATRIAAFFADRVRATAADNNALPVSFGPIPSDLSTGAR
jgi:pimeloyl-ACP methyl ester carboxylesterase